MKINKLFILSILTSSSLLFAQAPGLSENLNEDFLKSLPDEVRTDFLREMSDKNEVKDEVYNAPETSINTLETNVENLKFQLYLIEQKIREESGSSDLDLKRFGPGFFNTYQSTFMPINEPNFASDYIVDAGDSLRLQFTGSKKESLSAIIQKDGSINIPEAGKMTIAGLSLLEASESIQAYIDENFIGLKSHVTLTNMRNISVLVIGNATKPGVYTFNGGSNVLSVLHATGGINNRGSFRSILIKRNNKVIDNIDLYDVLINGNLRFKHGLRSGDAVVVSSKGGEVSVSGGIANPGIYEIKGDQSLQEILSYAGGLVPGSSNLVLVDRKVGVDKKIFAIAREDLGSFALRNGDEIKVGSFSPISNPIHQITISGEVVHPGTYTIADGETLSSALKRAGGYTDNAFEFGGILKRESAKKIEDKINKRIYQDLIKFIATSGNAKDISGGSTLPLVLGEFRNVKPVGRVTAEFNLSKLTKRPSLDTTLHHGDTIHIPPFAQEIYVLGEVLTPGARMYDPEENAKGYIEKSGGLGLFGDKERVVIISPNGDSHLYSGGIFSFGKSNIDIIPGTVIYIPREIGKLDGLTYASAIAPLFSSLALSLASLNSISD